MTLDRCKVNELDADLFAEYFMKNDVQIVFIYEQHNFKKNIVINGKYMNMSRSNAFEAFSNGMDPQIAAHKAVHDSFKYFTALVSKGTKEILIKDANSSVEVSGRPKVSIFCHQRLEDNLLKLCGID